jgi:hypothetical protein
MQISCSTFEVQYSIFNLPNILIDEMLLFYSLYHNVSFSWGNQDFPTNSGCLTGINIYSNFFIFVNSSHPFQLTFDKKTRHQSACFLSLPDNTLLLPPKCFLQNLAHLVNSANSNSERRWWVCSSGYIN